MLSRSVLIGIGAGALVIVAVLFAIVAVQQRPPFSQRQIGGAFTAVDTQGKPVNRASLLGKPSALYFGFTACPDICPTTLANLSAVLGRMAADASKINVAFVTIDPQRDTPEVMRAYLSSFDARIRGFTGSQAEIDAMADAFHVRFRRVPIPGGYTLDHTAAVLLFDKSLHVVGELPPDEDEATTFAKLRTLVAPDACMPGAPPRVDLWNGATLASTCSTP